MRRAASALALLLCGGLTCGPEDPTAPAPDQCSDPSIAPVIGTVEIGGFEEPFVAWGPGSSAEVTRGPQGGMMLGVVIRITRSGLSTCVAQETSILNASGDTLALSRVPLHTYEQPDGSRMTRVHWLIFEAREPSAGDVLGVRTVIHSTTVDQTIVVR